MSPTCKILVTGDYGLDHNLYLAATDCGPISTDASSRWVPILGGAGIIYRLLSETASLIPAASEKKLEVGFGWASSNGGMDAPHTVALWQPRALGGTPGEIENEKTSVWRLTRSLRLDSKAELPLSRKVRVPDNASPDFVPDILVVEDDAAGFRLQFPHRCWHPSFGTTAGASSPWIVLKTTAPLCQGDLWWTLANPECPVDRLVAVLSVDDLRREEVHISKGISWERTATDIVREFKDSPALSGLRLARHVIVVLHGEGVLWMRRTVSDQWDFQLVFDTLHMEGEWSMSAGIGGSAYGFMSCFTAAVAARMGLATEVGAVPDIASAAIHGLRVMRLLRILGHGEVGRAKPGFPMREMGLVLVADQLGKEAEKKAGNETGGRLVLASTELWTFGKASIPDDVLEREKGLHDWHILEGESSSKVAEKVDDCPQKLKEEPLYGIAKRVALFGPKALIEAPLVKFGKCQTVDRDEIEALNNLKQLIWDYRNREDGLKPLSLAAFGPPGAGKSFGIKEIALEVLGPKTPFLEFNLSQFKGVEELIGAFHQVRDKVLEGHTPVVFWDEFDSGNNRWLQYLLAPMQDGKFQEGQITHPIGKCIFVFAGATSYDLENFGPKEPSTTNGEEAAKARNEFKLRKGPDFKSRVHGYINVLGPNRRQTFDKDIVGGDPWKDDLTDVCFPVRRALLLRALLKLRDERLHIDRGLLSALLETDRYSFGARSFEKIVAALRSNSSDVIRRSSLPPDEIMSMNVDLTSFTKILNRASEFQKFANELAPAVHETYLQLAKEEGWTFKYDMSYGELPLHIKADNVEAARRIIWIVELAGLYLVRKKNNEDNTGKIVYSILESLLEVLAEEEHDLWMEFKFQQGWRYGEKRDDALRVHNCLIPYSKLGEKDREKDRNSVRNFPRIVDLAGFKIVRCRPK
ncbi:MAG: RyR domain-containing protein [Syntrophobacteraceae bacterium]